MTTQNGLRRDFLNAVEAMLTSDFELSKDEDFAKEQKAEIDMCLAICRYLKVRQDGRDGLQGLDYLFEALMLNMEFLTEEIDFEVKGHVMASTSFFRIVCLSTSWRDVIEGRADEIDESKDL